MRIFKVPSYKKSMKKNQIQPMLCMKYLDVRSKLEMLRGWQDVMGLMMNVLWIQSVLAKLNSINGFKARRSLLQLSTISQI